MTKLKKAKNVMTKKMKSKKKMKMMKIKTTSKKMTFLQVLAKVIMHTIRRVAIHQESVQLVKLNTSL